MRLDISGHHVEITDGIRENVEKKFEKIVSHYPQLDDFSVILTVERKDQIAEVNTQYLGTRISVESRKPDLYAAIADMVKKLDAKLAHKKGTASAGRHEKPVTEDPSTANEETN